MHVSTEHLEIAARLDAKVQRLLGLGYDDLAIFVEMADDMPDFKRLLDAGRLLMDELCRRFAGLGRASAKSCATLRHIGVPAVSARTINR
jgi:hypothetical protein